MMTERKYLLLTATHSTLPRAAGSARGGEGEALDLAAAAGVGPGGGGLVAEAASAKGIAPSQINSYRPEAVRMCSPSSSIRSTIS
jgi:hypothetical protein